MFDFSPESREIWLYDEFGPQWADMIDTSQVMAALKAMNDRPVTIHLNSPGGRVDEGIAIYNAISGYPGHITVIVDSLAASMASYLLQAGNTRLAASNAMVMIHAPWSVSLGNAESFRREADVLDKYAQRMVPHYAARSGKTEDEILAIMAEETWYAGQEIVDAGFADDIVAETELEPATRGLHQIARRVPESLLARKTSRTAAAYPRRLRAKIAACDVGTAEAWN